MNFLRKILLIVVVAVFARNTEGTKVLPPDKKTTFIFKIGFEFQETHNLCHFAKGNFLIQKKPIFAVMKGSQKLWHLEIDGEDIEFVTEPFDGITNRDDISLCIKSISETCNFLKLKNESNPNVSFDVFISEQEIPPEKKALIERYKLSKPELEKKYYSLEKHLRVSLEPTLSVIPNEEIYSTIKSEKLNIPPVWKAEFMPQITIQHHLENTIPLIVGLFISDAPIPTEIELNIIRSLPCFKEEKLISDKYLTKENGLLFLHALTCSAMVNTCMYGNTVIPLAESFAKIKDNLDRYKQVDPKLYIHFLSRRPFSSMWADITGKTDSFFNLYQERLIDGNKFFKTRIFPNFQFVNYAEEYYDHSATPPTKINFLRLKASIDTASPTLSSEQTATLDFLLSNGIISTGFIRLINPRRFESYLNDAIATVDRPCPVPYLNFETGIIMENPCSVDMLSPPLFLDSDNSMGAYTNDKLASQRFDSQYGESILEMRSIKFLPKKTLESFEPTREYAEKRVGKFLDGSTSLVEEVEHLLDFLKDGKFLDCFESNLQKYIDILVRKR